MSDRPGVAVFDTNVLVSGFLSPHGGPGRIVEWLRSGAVRAGLDDRIIADYEEALARPEFNLPRHDVSIVLRQIKSQAEYAVITPAHIVRGLPDADAAPFAECALALDCRLVTGNGPLFSAAAIGSLIVVSPRQFAFDGNAG